MILMSKDIMVVMLFSVNKKMDKSYLDIIDDSDYCRYQNADTAGGILFVFGINLDKEIK